MGFTLPQAAGAFVPGFGVPSSQLSQLPRSESHLSVATSMVASPPVTPAPKELFTPQRVETAAEDKSQEKKMHKLLRAPTLTLGDTRPDTPSSSPEEIPQMMLPDNQLGMEEKPKNRTPEESQSREIPPKQDTPQESQLPEIPPKEDTPQESQPPEIPPKQDTPQESQPPEIPPKQDQIPPKQDTPQESQPPEIPPKQDPPKGDIKNEPQSKAKTKYADGTYWKQL